LPFLLLSILFAVYYAKKNSYSSTLSSSKRSSTTAATTTFSSSSSLTTYENSNKNNNNNKKKDKKNISLVILSGIFLGLAIFTKIPVFTMIPLVAFLIISANTTTRNANDNDNSNESRKRITRRSWNVLGLWFIPVILIPAIWPVYAMSTGQIDSWLDGVAWQANRPVKKPLFDSINVILKVDTVLLALGVAGFLYAAIIKRDFFCFLGIVPFLVFLYFIGLVSHFHFIPLLPLLSISAALLIVDLPAKISKTNKKKKNIFFWKLLPFAIISAIGVFGLLNTIILITMNVTPVHLKTVSFVTQKLLSNNYEHAAPTDNNNNNNKKEKVHVIGSPRYFWIPRYIFDKEDQNDYRSHGSIIKIKTQKAILAKSEKVILIVDESLLNTMSQNDQKAKRLMTLYNNSRTVVKFNDNWNNYDLYGYPYISIVGIVDNVDLKNITDTPTSEQIEIKANY
jgi:hypothetical protein